MRSPAAAIAWEFSYRHRWGLAALVLYFVVLAAIRIFVPEPGQHFTEDSPWGVAFVTAVPTATSIAYFLAIFCFGLAGDIAARESMFPARMFTLPVTSSQLALWAFARARVDPARRLAPRLAAKRAAAHLLRPDALEREIEVVRGDYGPPRLQLSGGARERLAALGASGALVSLTHERRHAAALVLLLREPA